jgi:hypothetical protein
MACYNIAGTKGRGRGSISCYVITCNINKTAINPSNYSINIASCHGKARWQRSDKCRDIQGGVRAMKIIANKKHWSTKDYINTVLVEAIERDKFLQSYAP